MTACPLGRCTDTATCPNAPCVECMRGIGDQIIADIKALNRHRRYARTTGRVQAFHDIDDCMDDIAQAVSDHEASLEPAMMETA